MERPENLTQVVSIGLPVLVGFCALLLALGAAAPPDALAQAEVKRSAGSMSRSAGTMNRSSGTRRGSSLGSKTRGHEAGIASERQGSKPSFRSPGSKSDEEPSKQADETRSPSGLASRHASDKTDRAEGDPEQDEPDYGTRTLGRACMYGARGEVIFRPAGAVCRGDRPAPAAAPAGAAEPPARRHTRPARKKSGAARGRCIFGADGRVIHAPPGVVCER